MKPPLDEGRHGAEPGPDHQHAVGGDGGMLLAVAAGVAQPASSIPSTMASMPILFILASHFTVWVSESLFGPGSGQAPPHLSQQRIYAQRLLHPPNRPKWNESPCDRRGRREQDQWHALEPAKLPQQSARLDTRFVARRSFQD